MWPSLLCFYWHLVFCYALFTTELSLCAIHAPPIKCTFRGCLKMVKKTNMGQHLETHKNEPKMCKDCGLDFTSWKNSCIKNHPKKCTKERRTLVRRSSQKKSKKWSKWSSNKIFIYVVPTKRQEEQIKVWCTNWKMFNFCWNNQTYPISDTDV